MIVAEGTAGLGAFTSSDARTRYEQQVAARKAKALRRQITQMPPLRISATAPTAEAAVTTAASAVATVDDAVAVARRKRAFLVGGITVGLAVGAFVFRKALKRLFKRRGM